MLSRHGFTVTFNEILGPRLKEKYNIVLSSNKKNPIIRMIAMVIVFLINLTNVKLVLIDVYSGWAFYYTIILSSLSKLFNIPYITILHGGNLPIRLTRNKTLSSLIFKNSKINVSPSLYLKDKFQRQGYKIKFIPNFIDLSKYRFKHRVKCNPKLLWVRSLHEIYNPQMAIVVMAKIVKIFPNATLSMVGPDKDGSLKFCMELTKKLGLCESITFKGLMTKNEWISHSKSKDIFINTTNFDNMPVSVIEAMALGFPIVSTNVGGLKYLHEDGEDALLVHKNDSESMSKKILEIVHNQELSSKLSRNARRKVENYSWNNVKKSWDEILTI